MTPLLACPHCSYPRAKLFARPMAVRGRLSRVFFLVPGTNCDHIAVMSPANRDEAADAPESLITAWNAKATAGAAEVSAARGHTAQQAADFLAALGVNAYSKLGTKTWA